jgi:hypothetical protein
MTEPVRIVDHNREWRRLFQDRARAIRTEMGDVALRIDHTRETEIGWPSNRKTVWPSSAASGVTASGICCVGDHAMDPDELATCSP